MKKYKQEKSEYPYPVDKIFAFVHVVCWFEFSLMQVYTNGAVQMLQ